LRIASTDWLRKGLHQPDQVGGELAGVLAQHHQRSNTPFWSTSGTTSTNGSRPRPQHPAADDPRSRRDWGSRSARRARRLAERAAGLVDGEMAAFGRFIDADRFGQVELMVGGVIAVDQHRIGMGDFERAGGHRRQHGVEIERGGNRAADLLEALLARLIDCARSRVRSSPSIQVGIGFGELACHAVELVASSSSSSAVCTSILWSKSPAAEPPAPARSAVIGTSMRRANTVPA